MANQSDPRAPQHPVLGKPVVKAYPSPDLRDRIYVVRKDSRGAGYRLPEKGEAYAGTEAQKLDGFLFATAAPVDQTGEVDHFYLNRRANEDAYNFVIEYPYTDKDYPRVTRTYVLLRDEVVEPTADELDPVYDGEPTDSGVPNPELVLKLIDHKQIRFDDPVLDALFVSVSRTYERLPSPVITSYNQNEVKQVITVETQEVEVEDIPESSATTEILQVERTTTAKARVTTGTVPDVFPRDLHAKERQDLLPPEFRGLIPNITEGESIEGDAELPTLLPGDLRKSELQENEFVKRVEETRRDAPVTPAILQGKEVTNEQQIATVTRTYDDTVQTLTGSALVTEGEVLPLGDGTTAKRVVADPSVFPHKVYETERPSDLLPPEFRGILPNVTTETTSAGTAAATAIATGEMRHREEQLTLYRKRVTTTSRNLATLPQSFFNRELSGLEHGYGVGFTGIFKISWTLAAGQQSIDGDFYITEASVRNLGDNTSVKIVKRLDGSWPVLRERLTDDNTGIAVNITKRVISPLDAAFGPIANGYVDVRPYDKWRSIQITSKVDLDTLPQDEEYGITTDISLPDTLVSVSAEWQSSDHYHTSNNNVKYDHTKSSGFFQKENTTQIIAQVTVNGTIIVKLKNGYRGPARARLVRRYLSGVPGVDSIPSFYLLKIEPSTGIAYLRGSHASETQVVGFGVKQQDYSATTTFDRATIGPCLVGSYTIENKVFTANPVQPYASSKGFLEADGGGEQGLGTRVADNNVLNLVEYPLWGDVGGSGALVVQINASNPSQIYSGMEFLQSARVERWRFGIIIQELIYATVPY